ncbi:MAG: spore coat associated protein CotJA [Ruminococcaceae bacterium]|nr:spore coat associated protein CotJA [Oscillospiraceae bacterium]
MKGVLFLDNTRMLQRNGRLTNLSAYSTLPHFNRSERSGGCGCDGDMQHHTHHHAHGTTCECNRKDNCNECGYTPAQSCGCTREVPLAISSIGIQKWCDIYDFEQGFRSGTIFKQLDLPFCGCKGGHL